MSAGEWVESKWENILILLKKRNWMQLAQQWKKSLPSGNFMIK